MIVNEEPDFSEVGNFLRAETTKLKEISLSIEKGLKKYGTLFQSIEKLDELKKLNDSRAELLGKIIDLRGDILDFIGKTREKVDKINQEKGKLYLLFQKSSEVLTGLTEKYNKILDENRTLKSEYEILLKKYNETAWVLNKREKVLGELSSELKIFKKNEIGTRKTGTGREEKNENSRDKELLELKEILKERGL